MSLAEAGRQAASLLVDHDYVRLAARAGDGDALAASALLALALEREGVDFHFSTFPDLHEDALRRLRDERNEVLVLVDLPPPDERRAVGLAGSLVLVHDADGVEAPDDAVQVTAERANAPGGLECSASALAHGVALALSRRNVDLAPLALAGAYAEGQHAGGGLRGVNAEFAAEALERRVLAREPGLALAGDTLLAAVAQGVEPYFAGLAGRARVAQKWLLARRLPAESAPEALGPEDAERVASALTLRLLEQGAPEGAVDALVAERWRAAADGALAGEVPAALGRRLRAAAAEGAAGAAVSWAWDRAGADAALGAAEAAFRERALAALMKAERELAEPTRVLVLDAPSAAAARGLADLAALSLAPDGVPVVACAEDGPHLVVAGRVGRRQALSFDLGGAFRASAGALGGHAHGNRAMALARVPASQRGSLLAALRASVPAPREVAA